MRRSAFLAATALFMTVAGAAAAQSTADEALSLGQRGDEAMAKRRFHEALDLYTRADAIAASPAYVLGIARAEAAMGKFAAAHRDYEDFLVATSRTTWGDLAALRPAAESEAADVTTFVAHLEVAVNAPGASPRITMDGAPLAPNHDREIEVDPGDHVIAATADGYMPAETSFSIIEGGHATVALALAPRPAGPALEAQDAPTTEATGAAEGAERTASPNLQRTLGWATVAAGGVGLATSLVTAIIAVSKNASIRSECTSDDLCNPVGVQDANAQRSWATASAVSLVTGLVAGGIGAALVLTAPKAPAKVAPYVSLGMVGAVGTF
jgi:hypothetical protein